MRKIWLALIVLVLTLAVHPNPTEADHGEIPESVPGLSTTALPDLSKLFSKERMLEQRYKDPNPNANLMVAFTYAMPWEPDKVVFYRWRTPVPASGETKQMTWKLLTAFADGKILEERRGPILEYEHNDRGELMSVTITLNLRDGKPVSKTFTRPKK